VVAALRQRRISDLICETKNRPAKPGGFCLTRHSGGREREPGTSSLGHL
jgi:hypothetical protein